MASKTKARIKKEFDAFAAKVSQLELYKAQLEAMDTKGFESEVNVIKAKLHDVGSLNEIKRDIEGLRKKISQKSISRSSENKIHNVLFETTKALRDEAAVVKRKITELEGLIAKRKNLSSRKQLSHDEVESVKEIPKLEHQLHELRKAFSSHTQMAHVKVDSGVGNIVDSHFDDFIASIKSDLTQRLKEKELNIDQRLKEDLASREDVYARRYRALVEEFHEKYRKKVHDSLKSEVDRHFSQKLHDRLAKERAKIVHSLFQHNLKRLAEQRKHLVASLESDFSKKEHDLRARLNSKYNLMKKELSEKRKAVQKQLEVAGARESEFLKDAKMLAAEKSRLQDLYRKRRAALQHERSSLQAKLAKNLERDRKSHESRLSEELKHLRAKEAKLRTEFAQHDARLRDSYKAKERLQQERKHEEARKMADRAKALELRKKDIEKEIDLKQRHIKEQASKLSQVRAIFQKRYEDEESSLKRQYESRFKELDLRARRELSLKEKELAIASSRLDQTRRSLSREFSDKQAALRKLFAQKEAARMAERQQQIRSVAKEKEAIEAERSSLTKRVAAIKAQERAILKEAAVRMQDELRSHIAETDDAFAKRVAAMKSELHAALRARSSELRSENQKRLEQELKNQERILRVRLEKEYASKLASAISGKEEEIRKKKALLERHMMEHISKAFA